MAPRPPSRYSPRLASSRQAAHWINNRQPAAAPAAQRSDWPCRWAAFILRSKQRGLGERCSPAAGLQRLAKLGTALASSGSRPYPRCPDLCRHTMCPASRITCACGGRTSKLGRQPWREHATRFVQKHVGSESTREVSTSSGVPGLFPRGTRPNGCPFVRRETAGRDRWID